MYYLAVMDCDDEINSVLGDNLHARLALDVELKADRGEYSYEMQWQFHMDCCFLAVFAILPMVMTKEFLNFVKRYELLNTPHLYCLIGISCQLIACIFKAIYSGMYMIDGRSHMLLDVLGMIFDMLSECIMTMLVLMLANGWMTRFNKIDMDEGMELYVPLFLLVVIIHVSLGAFTYVEMDAHHKYLDFEGWVATLLILLKFVLVGIQMYYYSASKDAINKRAKEFYMKVVSIGLIYLLSDPVTIISSYLLAEWNRQFYYRLVDQGLHVAL